MIGYVKAWIKYFHDLRGYKRAMSPEAVRERRNARVQAEFSYRPRRTQTVVPPAVSLDYDTLASVVDTKMQLEHNQALLAKLMARTNSSTVLDLSQLRKDEHA